MLQLAARVDGLCRLLYRFNDLLFVARLKQIVVHPVGERAVRVLKIRITRQQDELQHPARLRELFHKVQPGKAGHFDIGQNDIRLCPAGFFISLPAVFTACRQLDADAFPIDEIAYRLP